MLVCRCDKCGKIFDEPLHYIDIETKETFYGSPCCETSFDEFELETEEEAELRRFYENADFRFKEARDYKAVYADAV